MKHICKRWLSLILSCALILTLLSTVALAEKAEPEVRAVLDTPIEAIKEVTSDPADQEVQEGTTEISDYKGLIDFLEKGSTSSGTLTADIEAIDESGYGYAAISREVSLDLNGHTITTDHQWLFSVNNGGALTVSDSVGTGEILQTYEEKDSGAIFYVSDGGKITIESGTYIARQYYICSASGSETNMASLTIDGGIYKAPGKLFDMTGCIVTINDGEYTSDSNYMIYLWEYSQTYIYGGTFTGKNGIAIQNYLASSSTDHRLTDEQYNAPISLVWGKQGASSGPQMNVTGAAIYGNYWRSPTDITINSGEIVSQNETAIYHPQQGTFTMNGGLIKGKSGIDAKMGNFIFNGGYVVATGEKELLTPEMISGKSTAEGSALVFETEFYGSSTTDQGWEGHAGGHYPLNNDLYVTINDGVFISKNNSVISVYDWNRVDQNVISFNITGGRFSSFPETIRVLDMVNGIYEIVDYLSIDEYKFAPAAYYDGVSLDYGFTGEDAPYYASMADAIADRDNDPDARAYIYYLLDNGLSQTGEVDRQLQIFYSLAFCGQYIPSSLNMGASDAVFGYAFAPSGVTYSQDQYVLTDKTDSWALWSPAVTYDTNGGRFEDGTRKITVLATTAYGSFDGSDYGYVVHTSSPYTYATKDELGGKLNPPAETVLTIPADPTRENAHFLGWFYADGTPFVPETTQIKANLTVYAHWDVDPIVPNWGETSKSKTATNLDENYESQVTLSLPSAEKELVTDVVFVLDKSTSADLEEQAINMLNNLKDQIKDAEATVKVGVVIFNKEANVVLPLTELTDGSISDIEAAIKKQISSGTNTHAGLLAGIKMLDDDDSVDDSRKYLIFVSDGITYMYNEEPTVTAWSFNSPNAKEDWHGPGSWQNWSGPDNWYSKYHTNDAPADWASWLTDIAGKVSAQGTAYEHTYGATIGNGNINYPEPYTAQDIDNWDSAYAMSIDKALYLTNQVYQEAVAAGYHCYAMAANPTKGSENTWGPSFMNYLAKGETVSFDNIEKDIFYVVAAGSRVEDYMGYVADDYNFDFVNDAETLSMKVGKETCKAVKIADNEYGFKPVDDGYAYTLTYIRGDGKGTEHFVWTINEAVTIKNPVQLTYTVKLVNPKTEDGAYGVFDGNGDGKDDETGKELEEPEGGWGLYTNNSATLYPVDSSGNDNYVPEDFPKPTVSYEVYNEPVRLTGALEIKKVVVGIKTNEAFEFTVTLTDGDKPLEGTYDYTGTKPGSITLDANGSAKVYLTSEDNISINNLPEGVTYEVQENTPPQYVTVFQGEDAVGSGNYATGEVTGKIAGGSGAVVTCVNTYQPVYYTVTVHYLEKGTERVLRDPVEIRQEAGSYYDAAVASQRYISGYDLVEVTGDPVTGTLDGNKVIKVYYTKETVTPPPVVTPGTPGTVVRPALNMDDHVAYVIGYEDGTVRPENSITRAEVTTIFFRLLTDESRAFYWSQTNSYSDVKGTDWYNNAISTMSNAGIITGYPDGTFRPNAQITRAEFAAIAARFSDVVYSGGNHFTDVPQSHWAYRYIALAQHLGWITGYPDGTFRPDQAITRAEAMTLINRVLEREVEEEHMLPDMVTWGDNKPSDWYYEAVQEATNSHEYTRLAKRVPGQDFCYEDWLKILLPPDWAALEKSWSTANSK